MKKLILIILFFTLVPMSAQAFEVEIEDCVEGSVKCFCPPEIGVDDFPYQDQIDTSRTTYAVFSCDELCTDLSEDYDVEFWQLQCTVEGTGIVTIGSGNPYATPIAADAPVETNEEETTIAPPDLAVDIVIYV